MSEHIERLGESEKEQFQRIVGEHIITRREHGEHVAAVAVISMYYGGHCVGVADAMNTGYNPIHALTFKTHDEAVASARAINKAAGVGFNEAVAVTICSMFRPNEYEAVRATLPADK